MKKKLFVTLLITLSTLFCTFTCVNAEDNINVTLNDETVTFDAKPVIQDDRILVPIRAIAEKMEFDVNWDQDTQTVTLENFNTILTLKIDENTIAKDLKLMNNNYSSKLSNIKLDSFAKIINERTYIPLRAVTEAFGCDVNWIQEIKTAEIIYPNTYGKEVIFKDKGIEYLTKLELLLDAEYHPYTFTHEFNDTVISKIKDCTLDELYPFKLYEGALKNITSLGFVENDKTNNFTKDMSCLIIPDILSLEDIKNFPNLNSIYMINKSISDISPITFRKNWENIYFSNISTNNFEPLLEITSKYIKLVNNKVGPSYNHKVDLSNISDEIKLNSSYDYFIKTHLNYLNTLQKTLNKIIENDMTTAEKILFISNWMAENIKYDYNNENINALKEKLKKSYEYFPDCSTSALLNNYGVCHDYAALFEQFCDALNIPCIYLEGDAYSTTDGSNYAWGSHAWNVVKLENGSFIHVDTTWDEVYSNNQEIYSKIIDQIFQTQPTLDWFIDSFDLSELNRQHKWNEEDIISSFEEKYGSNF